MTVACGRPPTPFDVPTNHEDHYTGSHWELDPYLLPYVAGYLEHLDQEGLDYGEVENVAFVRCKSNLYNDKKESVVGLTVYMSTGVEVYVDCTYENRYSEAITYHELTHAIFYLNHSQILGHIQYFRIPDYELIEEQADWENKVHDLMQFIKQGGDK